MDSKKIKVIAFYLPQFYTIPENDEWWGKGFTEWTSVGKAKKYFLGHDQPRVPTDLGYYDLRLPHIRQAQAELAKEAGISAFCYWHYWFGNGKQLLELPLQEVIRLGQPDFPFCLGWANHSWLKKIWSNDVKWYNSEILIKQEYPGKEDIDKHFYTMLPVFNDKRYYRIHGKLLFYIYQIESIPDPLYFMNHWQELAIKNNLPGFYFIPWCQKIDLINKPPYSLCDGIHLDLRNRAFVSRHILWRGFARLVPIPINIVSYKRAIKKWNHELFKQNNIYPSIIPNWDHSPRTGKGTTIIHKSTPNLFKRHVKQILYYLSKKENEDKIIFLKSWNEWAEGNYMEPDLKWGKGYIKALREALDEESL
jgi:hypothetical protein